MARVLLTRGGREMKRKMGITNIFLDLILCHVLVTLTVRRLEVSKTIGRKKVLEKRKVVEYLMEISGKDEEDS